jgi:hypothetical protein
MPVQRANERSRGPGIENPAGTAGGAQFDVYDSLSENTRLQNEIKRVAR